MNERIKELLKLELNEVFFFKNKEYHFYNDILLENFKLGVQIATSILSNNNGWISIKENGLPKENGKYLVYNYANNDVWTANFDDYCGFNNHHEKVTHYQKVKFPN